MMRESQLRPFVPIIGGMVKKATPEQITEIMQKVSNLCLYVINGEGTNPLSEEPKR